MRDEYEGVDLDIRSCEREREREKKEVADEQEDEGVQVMNTKLKMRSTR